MQKTINSLEAFELFLKGNPTTAVYFSTLGCNVCKALKPKFKELLNDEFPKISFAYVNVSDAKELAAQNSVFPFQQSFSLLIEKNYLKNPRTLIFQN